MHPWGSPCRPTPAPTGARYTPAAVAEVPVEWRWLSAALQRLLGPCKRLSGTPLLSVTRHPVPATGVLRRRIGGGVWHKASAFGCLPLAAPIGLSPLLILTLCGPERVLVVSTEPPDDMSCLTTPGVGRPGDGAVARAVDRGHPEANSESGGCRLQHCLKRWGVHLQDHVPDRGF